MNRQSGFTATRRIIALAGRAITRRGCAGALAPTLLLIGLALPVAQAQQTPAKDLVPFKTSSTALNQAFVIATDPPIVSLPSTVTGQSDLFGAFTGSSLATQHLGVDGRPLYITVVGEWTMANGDALSVEVLNVSLPPTAPGGPGIVGALTITNGKGRFLGARGSGFIRGSVQRDAVTGKETVILTAEGLITRPR
jgi:hypothetical protein